MNHLEIKCGDILKVEIDGKVMYLSVSILGGHGYVELQGEDEKGTVHFVELQKRKTMPKGWKKTYWTRIKRESPTE
jgi:hypothetical protein